MCCTSGSAIPTVLMDNDRVRVTEWRFKNKGANTGWHRHAYDYVVIPQFDGTLEIDLGNGQRTTAELQNGVPYFREIGVAHDVINANHFECSFIEVELLEAQQI
jgi:quercetin dioxygenase-like cupin family protein